MCERRIIIINDLLTLRKIPSNYYDRYVDAEKKTSLQIII